MSNLWKAKNMPDWRALGMNQQGGGGCWRLYHVGMVRITSKGFLIGKLGAGDVKTSPPPPPILPTSTVIVPRNDKKYRTTYKRETRADTCKNIHNHNLVQQTGSTT